MPGSGKGAGCHGNAPTRSICSAQASSPGPCRYELPLAVFTPQAPVGRRASPCAASLSAAGADARGQSARRGQRPGCKTAICQAQGRRNDRAAAILVLLPVGRAIRCLRLSAFALRPRTPSRMPSLSLPGCLGIGTTRVVLADMAADRHRIARACPDTEGVAEMPHSAKRGPDLRRRIAARCTQSVRGRRYKDRQGAARAPAGNGADDAY